MSLKVHKISKNSRKTAFTVNTVFREYFADLVKLEVHSLIKMKLSPMPLLQVTVSFNNS